MRPGGRASTTLHRVGGGTSVDRPVKAPGTTPRYHCANGYCVVARPEHGDACATGPTRRHGESGRASTRGPSVAPGAPNGAPVMGEHSRRGRHPVPGSAGGPSRRHISPECRPAGPQPVPFLVTFHSPQPRVAQPHWELLHPRGLAPHVLRCTGGRDLQTLYQSCPRGRPLPPVGSGPFGHNARQGRGGCGGFTL